MSWHLVSVKPRDGVPIKVILEKDWLPIDSAGSPNIRPDGSKEFGVMMHSVTLHMLYKDCRWYIKGGGPEETFY